MNTNGAATQRAHWYHPGRMQSLSEHFDVILACHMFKTQAVINETNLYPILTQCLTRITTLFVKYRLWQIVLGDNIRFCFFLMQNCGASTHVSWCYFVDESICRSRCMWLVVCHSHCSCRWHFTVRWRHQATLASCHAWPICATARQVWLTACQQRPATGQSCRTTRSRPSTC